MSNLTKTTITKEIIVNNEIYKCEIASIQNKTTKEKEKLNTYWKPGTCLYDNGNYFYGVKINNNMYFSSVSCTHSTVSVNRELGYAWNYKLYERINRLQKTLPYKESALA